MPNRSFHFIPAHKAKLLDKAADLEADHIIYDLEDAVPSGKKASARILLQDHLKEGLSGQSWVRCNAANTPDFKKDIALLHRLPTVGIVIPKFEDISLIDKIEESGLRGRRFIVIIESFNAVEMLLQISANRSIFGVGLGLEDLFSNIVTPNHQLSKLAQYIRLRVLVATKANGHICIDGVSTVYDDAKQLTEECEESRSLGYDGKFTIHPRQIAIVNRSFSISAESREWAHRILEKKGHEEAVGYTIVDGELITPPKVAKATSIAKALKEFED